MRLLHSVCLLLCAWLCLAGTALPDEDFPEFRRKGFVFSRTPGIGFEEGVTRRDPSDVDGTCYVWYSKVIHAALPPHKKSLRPSGYAATIWYATSRDRGRNWTEEGEALGRGAEGAFDSFAVFTPNIARINGQNYLYYTGVKPTPGQTDSFENNSVDDVTAIGVARADSPIGPFERISSEPILSVVTPCPFLVRYDIDLTAPPAPEPLEETPLELWYRPGPISLDALLDRPAGATTTADGPNRLVLTGRGSHDGKRPGVRFTACVEVRLDGGELSVSDSALAIRGADGVTFLVAAAARRLGHGSVRARRL